MWDRLRGRVEEKAEDGQEKTFLVPAPFLYPGESDIVGERGGEEDTRKE